MIINIIDRNTFYQALSDSSVRPVITVRRHTSAHWTPVTSIGRQQIEKLAITLPSPVSQRILGLSLLMRGAGVYNSSSDN